MAGWDGLHERPAETKWLRAELLGEDPDAERRQRMMQESSERSGRAQAR
jgi:hypothetical protein